MKQHILDGMTVEQREDVGDYIHVETDRSTGYKNNG